MNGKFLKKICDNQLAGVTSLSIDFSPGSECLCSIPPMEGGILGI